MSLGVIARADNSGLAMQTWEMARHTTPARVLLVHPIDANRGALQAERFDGLGEVTVAYTRRGRGLEDSTLAAWLDGLDVVYTAEGDYGGSLALLCARRGIRLVVHANPELWQERYRDATTTVVTPTDWEADRVPGSRVMPMPVARDRLPWRQRTEALTFWHPGAPAFHDRHGTEIIRRALHHLDGYPMRFTISGTGEIDPTRIGALRINWIGPRANYWDGYDDADVLVLPRRYAGLSLPVQEALSAGLPVVMLDTGPYAGKPGVLSVPTTGHRDEHMKGGYFAVHTTSPELVAAELEELFLHPDLVERTSKAADETAETLSWDTWTEPWRSLLS